MDQKVTPTQASNLMFKEYSVDFSKSIVRCAHNKNIENRMGKVEEDAHLTIKEYVSR